MQDDSKHWKSKIQQLKSHSSSLDIPVEWDVLEKRMDKKARRKVAIWWWPVMIGLAVSAGYFYISKDHQQADKTLEQSKNQRIASENKVLAMGKYENGEKINVANDPSGQTTRMPDQQKAAQIYDPVKADVSKKEMSKNENKNLHQKQVITHTTSEPSFAQNQHKTEPQTNEISLKDLSAIWPMAEDNNSVPMDQDLAAKTKSLDLALLVTPDSKTLSTLYPNSIPMNMSKRQNRSKPIFLDIRTLIGKPVYDYHPVATAHEGIAINRKKYEQPLESVSSRLSIGKETGHKFYVALGVSYSMLNDRWKSSRYDTMDVILDNQIIEQYTSPEGIVTEKTGKKLARQIVEVTQTRYNTIQSLATMISLGKYFNIHKMRWTIEANVALPIFTRYTGQALDQNDRLISIDSIYNRRNSLQYGLHLSYLYPVSGRLALYGGYDYNYARLHTNQGYFRNQKIHSISVGMKYFIYH